MLLKLEIRDCLIREYVIDTGDSSGRWDWLEEEIVNGANFTNKESIFHRIDDYINDPDLGARISQLEVVDAWREAHDLERL